MMDEQQQVTVTTGTLTEMSMAGMLMFANEQLLRDIPETLFGVDLSEFRAAQQKVSEQLTAAIRTQLGIKD